MKNGPYELVLAPPDYPGKRYRGRYVYEHHLVWWQNTGALPPSGYDVHHKDGQKRRNLFSNLELKEKGSHTAHHNTARTAPSKTVRCGNCRARFEVTGRLFKQRMKASQSGKIYCTRSCQVEAQQRELHSRVV